LLGLKEFSATSVARIEEILRILASGVGAATN
jgi:hypothetical protein